ncbi:leishmanolysin family protein (macronuclear) [Tetrahymena thermophila SB210]|uniref:Leishmanolysin family protein n=1 Tax=Tetrahymena thermophila (strain SB210) TaxID=312017 RepID=I7MK58_TETTS|nr:leishmanolysin family protein [Tetrahymena thermophila SB210]EAR97554.2 leishmanolysin family protein [Tetrahymena thermophila SB210]|eukprot:XP_001017799.2 leishmanolysin family protein [Tetrahymena thermophila SB210]
MRLTILIIFIKLVFFKISCEKDQNIKNNTQQHPQGSVQTKYNVDFTKSEPIRVTFNYASIISNTTITEQSKTLVMNAIDSSGLLIQNLLKVNPRPNPIPIRTKYHMCFTKEENPSLQDQIPNTDLFVFISWFEDNSTTIAKSAACFVDRYPIIGRIFVNHAKINGENKRYSNDQLIKIFVHELTHILAFSRPIYVDWINPQTNEAYGQIINKKLEGSIIDDQKFTVLTTPKSKEQFQSHYKCVNILGLPLEQLMSKSHFPQQVMRDELMDSNIVKLAADMTQFTMAIYKDSNFYTEVNENLFTYSGWGYHQGCQYFTYVNNTQTKIYQQLNLMTPKLMDSKCDPAGYGKYNTLYLLNEKNGFQQSTQTYCSLFQKQDLNHSGEEFSNQSKCYSSSLQVNTVFSPFFSEYKNTRCFKTTCLDSGSLLLRTSFNQTFQCDFPGQKIDVQDGQIQGYIVCPDNFQIYCGKKLFCKDGCSLNGFCLKGICVCKQGFGGLDCSTKLQQNQMIFQKNIINECPENTYLNPNNVCMSDCVEGYYKSGKTCQKCSSKCSECKGPPANQCTKCNMQYHLQNGDCIEKKICSQKIQEQENCQVCAGTICTSCLSGYLLQDRVCKKCSSNCLECFKETDFCLSCKSGFVLSQNKCIQPIKGCKQQDQNNPSACLQCQDDYFLDSNNTCVFCGEGYFYDYQKQACQKCSSNCKSCINYPDTCTSCFSNYFFNLKNNACIMLQNPQSSRILNSINSSPFILGENDFFYYQEQASENCHFSCQVCSSSEYDSCLVCSSNRIFTQSIVDYKNFCICPPGSSDYGVFGCFNDYVLDQVKFFFITIAVISIAQFAFSAFFERGSLISLFTLIDYFQSISFLRFINKMYYANLDDLFRILQFTNIFNIQVLFERNQKYDDFSVNSKFLFEKKTFRFFQDSLILVVIMSAIQLTYLILSVKIFKQQKTMKDIAQKCMIILNIFAVQEMALNVILNIQFSSVDQISIIQIVFGIIFMNLVIIQTVHFITLLSKQNKYLSKDNKCDVSIQIPKIPASVLSLHIEPEQNKDTQMKQNSIKDINQNGSNQQVASSDQEINEQNQQNVIKQQNYQKNPKKSFIDKFQLQYLISYFAFILLKIAYPILLTLQSKSSDQVLIYIGGIFIFKLIVACIILRKYNKKTLCYIIFKQIQFLAIIGLYITLIKLDNKITSTVLSASIGVLTYIDSAIYIISKLITTIYKSTKHFIKHKKMMLNQK